MARLSKIPDHLTDEILKKAQDKLSSKKIKEWLKKEHNLSVGETAIQTLIKRETEEKNAVAKQAYATAVAETAQQDVDILGDKIRKLNQKVDLALSSDDPEKTKVYGDLLFKFLDRKLKLVGADEKAGSLDDQTLDSMLEKLGK